MQVRVTRSTVFGLGWGDTHGDAPNTTGYACQILAAHAEHVQPTNEPFSLFIGMKRVAPQWGIMNRLFDLADGAVSESIFEVDEC